MRRESTARGSSRRRVAIVGGGIGGLAAAILLARRGLAVTVLERDRRTPAESADEAFARWERRGVAQFRHSHTFLARLTCVLRERLPEVLDLLRAHGALELPLTVAGPRGLDLGPRQRGDGELVLLGARRAAVEWALWRVALAEPNLELREGVVVDGLLAAPGGGERPRVAGVRLRRLPDDGPQGFGRGVRWRARAERGPRKRAEGALEDLPAELVIDASGRRSAAPDWLRAIGAPPPRDRSVPTGILYLTRFYRLTGRRPPGASAGLIAGDLGWIKLATFPGDAGTFSITVGVGAGDRALYRLAEPAAFEAIVAAFPEVAPWRARGVSRPIDGARTPVLVMGGLENRKRSFVRDGAPLAAGFFAIGDSAYHTNPIYGRGATCAVLAAAALDDALQAHPDDLAQAARTFDERARREIEPFWYAAAAADRAGRAQREGTGLDAQRLLGLAVRPQRAAATILGLAIGLYFERGVLPATRSDPTVYRAVMRVLNMLDDPRTALLAPEVIARVLTTAVGSLAASEPARRFAGPSRREALEIIARVTTGRTARRATTGRSAARGADSQAGTRAAGLA